MPRAFFKDDQLAKPISKTKLDCNTCGLNKGCITPDMPVSGQGLREILVIAEAPGKTEDEQGVQLIGQAGKRLRTNLYNLDIDLNSDCWKYNAVNCRPSKNRTPTTKEINCCRSKVQDVIRKLRPKKIILLGKTAIDSVIGCKMDVKNIAPWLGCAIPDMDYGAWLFPTYHPSYLLRNEKNKALKKIFSDHLQQAIEHDADLPLLSLADYKSMVECLDDYEEVASILESISLMEGETIAIDYETTGLKPHAKGHHIVCASVAWDNNAISFPLSVTGELLNILTDPKIKKVAHNIPFEESWTRENLGQSVQGWESCTMNTAHVLNNTGGTTGLKFQVYTKFGIAGYDNDIAPYLKAKDSNGFNTIDKAPLDDLLMYCGLDSLFTLMLHRQQQEELSAKQKKAYKKFIHPGILTLADATENGIHTDDLYYRKQNDRLKRLKNKLTKKIKNSKIIKEWEDAKGREIKFNIKVSDADMRELLFDHLQLEPIRLTDGQKPSVDRETLVALSNKHDLPFLSDIIRLGQMEKIRGTYLKNYMSESVQGVMHPNFNLHLVATYRSSSDRPNFQNVPVRDEAAKKITRSGIIPSKGNLLYEVDYSGAEVRVAACVTKDRRLIKYINDPSSDMHKDQAALIYKLPIDRVSKMLRFYVKNQWVFPQFYGSWYVPCAENIWFNIQGLKTEDGQDIFEHLADEGLTTLEEFTEHLEPLEKKFWKRFDGYNSWKEKQIKNYEKRGYIDLITGFRCGGLMSRNQILNYPIQGPAFHILLWSMIKINELLKMHHFDTKVIGQIHDSIVFDAVPDELDDLRDLVKLVMTNWIRDEFPWIIVPFEIEEEATAVNQSWFTKEEI